LASKRDRLEALEKKLEQNRNHMQKEAKKAGKMEKKIKTLTGGYQALARKEIEDFQTVTDSLETLVLEKTTFEFLQKMESQSIPRRVEVLVISI
jgi:pre-mRNA-splicing factor CDC5/CEF1